MINHVRAFILIMSVMMCGCIQHTSENSRLEHALEYAGENAPELRKVLAHYRDSTEKLASAEFLIRNLPHWFSWKDRGELDSIENLLHKVAVIPDAWYFPDLSDRDWRSFSHLSLPKVRDAHAVTSDYLISNIDAAYRQRAKRTWNRDLPDDDFNNFLLPYRIGDEKLSDWRKPYEDRYGVLLDSLYPGGDDSLRAAEIVNSLLEKEGFKYNVCALWPHRRATDLLENTAGPCRDQCDRQIYALRGAGIPCAVDAFFVSPETGALHEWVVVRDNRTGRFIPLGREMVSRRDSSFYDRSKRGKVYRYLADAVTEGREAMESCRDVKSVVYDYYLKDVTSEYFGENTLDVEIENPDGKTAMLGVFTPSGWRVVDYAVESGRHSARFRDVEPGIIYMPLIENGKGGTVPCGYPVEFRHDLSARQLKPGKDKTEMTLGRKFPFMPYLYDWFSRGVGGAFFELSMNRDFKGASVGGRLPDTLPSNLHVLHVPSQKTRYIRYSVPGTDEMVIGEIEVYSDSAATEKVPVRVTTAFDRYRHPERVTDGDLVSFFAAPLSCRSIILETERPEVVSAIGFMPRNDDNFVWEGHRYRLLYFDSPEKGWQTADEKVADGREITMSAPEGALYWLRDLTKGREEEIFVWRDNRQTFVHDL